jgi:ubiquitin carboxyl-terminal hydrolase 4/11
MYLTLPLPVQKKWRHTVYYVPWDLDKPHTKVRVLVGGRSAKESTIIQVPVEIGRDASFKDLRALISRWMGAPAENVSTWVSSFWYHLLTGL